MALSTINTVCQLEDFLLPAPASVAILGQLMAIATTTDFSIASNAPQDGFKHVKHPESFRACLVHISTSGCDAFTNAHINMDKIRLHTMQFQGNVKDLVQIMLQGSPSDKMNIAPIFLDDIKKQANQCLNLAVNTQSDFSNLTKLLVEVSLAATTAKGLHEKYLDETTQQSQILKHRQELVEHQKAEIQKDKDEVISKLSAAKTAFEKSENELPGPAKMILMNTWDQGLKVASSCTNIFALSKLTNPVGIASVVVKGVGDFGLYACKHTNKGSQKKDESKALTTALKNASEIHLFNIILHDLIETRSCQEPSEKSTIEDTKMIHNKLEAIVKDLESSHFVLHKDVQTTIHLCKRSIAVCSLLEQTALSTTAQLKYLLTEIDSILKESATLKTVSDQFLSPGYVNRLNNSIDDSKEGLAQLVTDSMLYKVEIRKQELDFIRKKQEAVVEKAREIDEKQNKILEDLLKTDLKKINFEEIIKTLSRGMQALGQIDEQWRMLVLYFSKITNCIDVCLHQQTETFNKTLHRTEYQLSAGGTKEIILEIAASVNAVAYSVGLVAETYTDISAKHLVQATAGLVKIIALHPERDETELNVKRLELNEKCSAAQQRIRQLAAKRREMALDQVRGQFEKINLLESKMPALEDEKRQKIRKDVATSLEIMCHVQIDTSDYL